MTVKQVCAYQTDGTKNRLQVILMGNKFDAMQSPSSAFIYSLRQDTARGQHIDIIMEIE